MASEIKLKIKVDDDGSLNIVAKEAKKAAKSTDKLTQSTDTATKARNRYSKGEKGVAQMGMNSTKAFSKMNQTMVGSSGLVGAYATLAANVFALTAAFGILQRAAAAQQLAAGLEYTGQVAGRNLPYIADQLKNITGAAVSTQEAMTAVATATAAGFSSSQIADLAKVAKGASLALGRDMTDALNRLIRGSAKLEPELLDELGIMVRLDDAAQDYATQLGTTVENLTQYQKRQAFVNAVIKEGQTSFSGIANAIEPNAYDQLAAALQDLLKNSVTFINKALAPMARFFSTSKIGLIGGALLFASTIRGALLPGLTQGAQRMANFASESKKAAAASFGNVQTAGKLPKVYTEVAEKIKNGTATTKDFTQAQNSLAGSLRKHNSDLDNHANFQDKTTTKYAQKIVTINEVENAQSKLNNTLILSAQAETASARAAAINSAAQLDVAGTIKNIRTAMALYRIEITATAVSNGAASASFAGLKVAIFGASLSFKALGVALLAAMPYLALIPLLFGAMKSAWDKFFGDSSVLKKQKEIFDSLEHINEVGIRLNKTLMDIELRRPPTAGWDTFTAKLTAAAGAAAQIRDRVSDAVSAQLEDKALKIAEAMTAVEEAELEVAKAARRAGGDMKGVAQSVALIQAEADLKELQDSYNKISVKPIIDGLEKALVVSRALGEDSGVIQHTQNQIDKLRELGETADAIDIGRVMKPPSDAETTSILLQSFTAGLASFSEEYAKFSAKVSTPFDKMSAGLDEAIKSLTQRRFEAPTGLMVFTEEAANLQKQLEDGETPLAKFAEKFKVGEETGLQTLQRVNGEIKNQIKLIQETPGKIAEQSAELSKLNEVRKVSGAITEKAHKIEDEIIRLKDEELKARVKVLEALNLTKEKTAEILKLEADIVANNAKQKSGKQKALEVLEGEQGLKKLMLAQDQKALNMLNARISRSKKAMEEEARARNAADPNRGYDATLNARDRLKIEEDLVELRKQGIRDEYSILLVTHNMEYALLQAKLDYLREQAAGNEALLESLNAYETKLTAMKKAGVTNLEEARDAKLNTVDADIKTGERSVKAEVLGAKGSTPFEVIQSMTESAGGSPFEVLDKTSEKIKAVGLVLSPMMEELKKLGPEGELVAAVAQGALVIGESWSLAFDKIKEGAVGMEKVSIILGAVAQTVQQIGAIMAAASRAKIAGIDQEIEAEKKRDGKSAQSVAKIKALEKKKEAAARKAFEVNKKMQMASVVISTAAAVAGALAWEPKGWWNIAAAIMVGAMGMAQLAIISGTSYQGGASGGGASTPGSVSVGERRNNVDMAKSRGATGELAYMRGESGRGGPEDFRGAFYGRKHRAAGGATGYVVGEQGPELFMPDRPGTIVPADDAAAAAGAASAVTFNINTVDATGVEDLLIEQQGNIIGMIRQAANSYGQEFMEDIDVATFTTPAVRRA